MKMSQKRITPENYMKLHHRTLNNSIRDATLDNIDRAKYAFNNLNPIEAARMGKEEVEARVDNPNVVFDSKQFVVYSVVAVTIGVISGFLGNWLWQKYKEG